MRKSKRVMRLKRKWLLLLGPIAALFLLLAKFSPEFAEFVFARGIYKLYSQLLSLITGIIPCSLAEILIIFVVVAVPIFIMWRIAELIIGKGGRGYLFRRNLLNIGCIISVVVFMLFMGCTINYNRYSFAEIADLEVKKSSKKELYNLCLELAERTNAVREQLNYVDENNILMLMESNREMAKICRDAYTSLAVDYSVMSGFYAAPKYVNASRFMSMMEITGMFVPFTMEANVNVDIPEYSIPSTMCHEIAHLHGFIREDEANYIAYLACMASDNLEVQYSGLMDALIYAGNALASEDYGLYLLLRNTYSEGVNSDLAANSEYWAQFEDTVISNTSSSLNDAYLVANNQKDGIKSYGRMVDLLLAEYRKNHEIE